MVQSIRYDASEVLVLNHWMLPQHLHLVHLYHALHQPKFTAVTFSQLAAPLMLFSTGEDSVKGTCFFTSMMNFMQFIYIYSSEYFSMSAVFLDHQYFVYRVWKLEFGVTNQFGGSQQKGQKMIIVDAPYSVTSSWLEHVA